MARDARAHAFDTCTYVICVSCICRPRTVTPFTGLAVSPVMLKSTRVRVTSNFSNPVGPVPGVLLKLKYLVCCGRAKELS